MIKYLSLIRERTLHKNISMRALLIITATILQAINSPGINEKIRLTVIMGDKTCQLRWLRGTF